MGFPASLYLGFWGYIGIISLYLGFRALNKTDLPATLPPAVLFLFKHFLITSVAHSTTHTLVFRTKLKIHVLNYYALFSLVVFPIAFATIAGETFDWSFKIYCVVNAFVVIYYNRESVFISVFSLLLVLLPSNYVSSYIPSSLLSTFNFMILLQPCYTQINMEVSSLYSHWLVMYTLLNLGYFTKSFSPIVVLFTPLLTCVAQAAVSGDERFRGWLPTAAAEENRIFSKLKKFMERNGNVVEFSAGMAATILFQYFFRLTSFDHVVAFLFFAVAWLANLAILLCRRDIGVFNFFLSNVIVGCTVSEFGVGRTTWLAYAAALLLYVVRVKLDLICVLRRDNKEAVIGWRQNQTLETNQIV